MRPGRPQGSPKTKKPRRRVGAEVHSRLRCGWLLAPRLQPDVPSMPAPASMGSPQWRAAPARRPARRAASNGNANVRLRRRVHAQGLHLPPPSQADEMPRRASTRGLPAWRRSCDTTAASSTQGLVHRGVRRGAGRRVLGEGRAADCNTAAGGGEARLCVSRSSRACARTARAAVGGTRRRTSRMRGAALRAPQPVG